MGAEATQEATMEATQEPIQEATMDATQEVLEESKKTVAMFNGEDELKPVVFLKDNELLYNKRLIYYKDANKREAVWDKFCPENNMEKAACNRWSQSQKTMYGMITHINSGQGAPHHTDRQNWLKKNFGFLHTYIIHQRVNLSQPVKQQCQGHPILVHQEKSQVNPKSESPVQWSKLEAYVHRLRNH